MTEERLNICLFTKQLTDELDLLSIAEEFLAT